MSRGDGTRLLLRAVILAALLACLSAAPAQAAPTVTIDDGPTGPTNESSPTFTFTALEATTVDCSVDQGTEAFAPCSSPHTTVSLADGTWTFRVRASDGVSPDAIATRSFTVDTEAPTVELTPLGPDGPTNNPRPTFGWDTAEENDRRECSVDEGIPDFGPCTSPNEHRPVNALADGFYTFRIRITDLAGNPAAEATRDFSVDTAGPAAEVAGSRRTGNRRPSFQVSSPESGAILRCKLDGNPRVRCGPTFRPGRKLKPGRHKLLVTAFDDLGNPGPPKAFRFKILKPPLKAGRAEGTVATALRRHKFANRVVANLEQSCSRVGRFKFSCRFSSGFPGYSLNGRGPVELQNGRISYRFRVRAQGRTLILTDENEGSFPG